MFGQGLTQRLRTATSGVVLVLVAVWALTGGFADFAPASDPGPVAGAASKKQRAARVERRLLRCTNVRREKHGLRPLRVATALKRAARFHAKNMARLGFFDHIDHRGRGPAERVALFKPKRRLRMIGENLAAGQTSAIAACRSWMASSGHRRNILGHYNRVGVGFWPGGPYRRYYVQVFARAG